MVVLLHKNARFECLIVVPAFVAGTAVVVQVEAQAHKDAGRHPAVAVASIVVADTWGVQTSRCCGSVVDVC